MLTPVRHRAAVLGKPIRHSLSPALHRAAYEALGLQDWSYEAHECDVSGLPELVAGLGPTWAGLSLTMPLKERALLVASNSTDVARRTGAVNTLIRTRDGWRGDNTDVVGVRQALVDAGIVTGGVRRAVIVGSGATARSALAAIADLGVREVELVVRDQPRPSTIAQARDHGMAVQTVRMDDAAADCADAELLINTTPSGAADGLAEAMSRLAARADMRGGVLLDVVYAGWPTALARVAAAYRMTVVPGIEMLIHQAAAQVEQMTGRTAPLAVMQQVGRAAVA
ncbi:shikimate dehydrogenase [Rudaeicoccus suwonensis]|uniref:Shikimate dehydrogenase n=1 Tax=Rudaeicoccus suwonensis TaxID=657409 RepID=A0A561EAA2_9MICO|nr:shikimate dehydrogenase [Rudaeicoccus suwonensis]